MSEVMDHWKTIILSNFHKTAKQKWFNAAMDFQLVDKGIKPACLFDQWATSAQSMQNFLAEAHKQGLIHNHLHMLSIGQDVLICSPMSFTDDIFQVIRTKSKFVDITSSLSMPVLMNQPELLTNSAIFKDLCQTQKNTMMCNDVHSIYDVEIDENLNVPCLFGVLLGYPCVYWYDTTIGEENCLSGQTLYLFKVKGQILSNKVATVASSKEKLHDHVIFSFTVPENLIDVLHCHVTEWFLVWKDSVKWSKLFSAVWMEESSVNAQAVCL